MRHVLESVEVLIFGGDFDPAAPAAGAVVVQAAGIRNRRAINPNLVVVEPFVLGTRVTDPGAAIALGQGVFYAADVELDVRGLGRDDRGPDTAFRVDHRVFFALLVGCRGLEIFRRLRLGRCIRRRRRLGD